MTFSITNKSLAEKLTDQADNTIVIDVRFNMGEPGSEKQAYLKGHIPGAVYLDIDKDLSGPQETHGGGHPLPDIKTFAKKLGDIGVDHGKDVIIYDEDNAMFAARAWWMFHYVGLENVFLLDGGLSGWLEAGHEVTSTIPNRAATTFEPKLRDNAIADMNDVKENTKTNAALLIDSRAKDRYLGKTEPLYAKAGHIPGAKNYFWKDVQDDNGSYKSKADIEEMFSSVDKDREIIVSCGSGISACPNIIALKSAGYTNVKLYPGSFSDWISYEDNELETKDE